ncbi:MAG: NUDIX hydrolase [Brevinematales bacterium]|nr:NUDIX hydrolase [Brevinematales bacterium]
MGQIEIRLDAVIFNDHGEILLARHEKNTKSYWVLPGGHLEFGESLDGALRRELSEELGFEDVEVKELVFVDEVLLPSRHVLHIGFDVHIVEEYLTNPGVITENETIKEVRFFSLAEIVNANHTFYPSKEFIIQLIENRTAVML